MSILQVISLRTFLGWTSRPVVSINQIFLTWPGLETECIAIHLNFARTKVAYNPVAIHMVCLNTVSLLYSLANLQEQNRRTMRFLKERQFEAFPHLHTIRVKALKDNWTKAGVDGIEGVVDVKELEKGFAAEGVKLVFRLLDGEFFIVYVRGFGD